MAVEVELEFSVEAVQKARSDARFSDRVWLAVPVLADVADAAAALRSENPSLFDHAIDAGLGILACRPQSDRSYEVVPVQWPTRSTPDPVEKEALLERYRRHFEQARVIAPRGHYRYPRVA